MEENSAYQPSTRDFTFARNLVYRTNVGITPEIETEENAAYHCDNVRLLVAYYQAPINLN